MMSIQNSVLLTYRSITKRIHSWLLPLLIFFLLGTAHGKTNPTMLTYFSWTELNALHFYGGWMLCLVWLLVVYDFFFAWCPVKAKSILPPRLTKTWAGSQAE